MKNFILLSATFVLFLFFTSCNTEALDETNSLLTSENSKTTKSKSNAGYDAWGFNFKAHNFKSYLINAMLGDPAFEGMPHYRKPGVVYLGEGQVFWDNLVAEYPYFVNIMPPGLLDCKMEMKWNDALLNSEGVYPPTWNDTGAWIMFKYKMNTESEKWNHIRKFVCISEGDELIDGIWYNSDGQEIGMESYYWGDSLIIKQVINTGDNPWVPYAMPPDYLCPNWVGFGNI